jgi:hypothetical protein
VRVAGWTRASEPPPEPIAWMSTLGRKYSYCATFETKEYCGRPPCTMPTSNEVPPISVVMMFSMPISEPR